MRQAGGLCSPKTRRARYPEFAVPAGVDVEGSGVGRAMGVAEVEMGVEQFAEQESLSEAGGKQQPGLGDGVAVVEGDGDLVRAVG